MTQGPYLLEGSIYEPMAAAISRDNRTIAHFGRFEDARDVADRLNAATALLEALQQMMRVFVPFPREDTEGWREEHEAYEQARAALALSGDVG